VVKKKGGKATQESPQCLTHPPVSFGRLTPPQISRLLEISVEREPETDGTLYTRFIFWPGNAPRGMGRSNCTLLGIGSHNDVSANHVCGESLMVMESKKECATWQSYSGIRQRNTQSAMASGTLHCTHLGPARGMAICPALDS